MSGDNWVPAFGPAHHQAPGVDAAAFAAGDLEGSAVWRSNAKEIEKAAGREAGAGGDGAAGRTASI
jgi:hypothetical protein